MRWEDYRATLIIMSGLAAAALTGFVREASLAYQLGVGRATDTYLIAFTIPEFIFTALPIVLVPAFIPLFADLRLRAGERGAWRFGGRVAWALFGLLLGLTALVGLSSPFTVRWLAPGFDGQQRAQATQALTRMLPALSLMGGATLAGAILQAYRRFARPALATALYNGAFVAALIGLPLASGVDRAAWGVTLGAAAALALQLPLLWRHRPSSCDARQGESAGEPVPIGLAAFWRLAGPLAVGYAVHHIIYFVDRAMATTAGSGSVATLNYAYRVALVAGQLSGLAVSTALFPRMAEQAAGDDLAGLRSSLSGALRFVWMVGLPASGALIVLRTPLIRVLFERGAFDRAATAAVGDVLGWYALAVLADALCQPLWRIVYARRRAWTVLAVNGLQTGVRILANLALIRQLGYSGLAISAVLGLAIQAAVLGYLARRSLGAYLTAQWCKGALRVVVAAVLGLAAASGLTSALAALPPPVPLLAGGALGALIYGVLLRVRKTVW